MDVMKGRVWKFGDDINTDLIAPGGATKEERIARCMQANRPGWSKQVAPGDMLFAGFNFGTGSSRPAAQNFTDMGLQCVIAESVNGLFLRNSINFGLPIFACKGIDKAFDELDVAEVDLEGGTVKNLTKGTELHFQPLPQMFLDILGKGGLVKAMFAAGLLTKLEQDSNRPARAGAGAD
ncbi:MAG: 3-isopropylmalate dehydratase [Chloroflexi bacterium]|nr:3-isopropylmalate dehydratase [Chloroflexota bacterium]